LQDRGIMTRELERQQEHHQDHQQWTVTNSKTDGWSGASAMVQKGKRGEGLCSSSRGWWVRPAPDAVDVNATGAEGVDEAGERGKVRARLRAARETGPPERTFRGYLHSRRQAVPRPILTNCTPTTAPPPSASPSLSRTGSRCLKLLRTTSGRPEP